MAKLTVFYGPIFSRKTSRLITQMELAIRDGKCIEVFQAANDGFRTKFLGAHDQNIHPVIAVQIKSPWQIFEFMEDKLQAIFVDDVDQFDTIETIDVFKRLLERKKLDIQVAGRDLDNTGKRVPALTHLIRRADDAQWCLGICRCGDAAAFTYSHSRSTLIITPGESEARCEACFNSGRASCTT